MTHTEERNVHTNSERCIPVSRFLDNEDDIFIFPRDGRKSSASEILFKKKRNKKYYKILTLYEYVKLFGIKLFYLRSELMLHVSKFVWTLRSSVRVIFTPFYFSRTQPLKFSLC